MLAEIMEDMSRLPDERNTMGSFICDVLIN